MKILLVFCLFFSINSFAKECKGMCEVQKLDFFVSQRELAIKLMKKIKIQTDTRKVFNAQSPDFLESYGKFMVNGIQRCTANIVSDDNSKDSFIVTTAEHCIKKNTDKFSVIFTKKNGRKIKRNLSLLTVNKKNDYAILKLNRVILNSQIKPLSIAKNFYDVWEEADDEDYELTITVAGFSGDEYIGEKGKVLTYDQDCELIREDNSYTAVTNCTAYKGASGGAMVISYIDYDDHFHQYFAGVNHSVSLNPYALEKPQSATFIMSDELIPEIKKYLLEN